MTERRFTHAQIDRLLRPKALFEPIGDEVSDAFAVRLARKDPPPGLHLFAKRLEILDDPVVDDGDAVDDVRMSIADGRRSMGRPTRMGDADSADERRGIELPLEIVELALGPAALKPAIDDRAQTGTVITAIFEPPEAVHQPIRHFGPSDDSDNPTHTP